MVWAAWPTWGNSRPDGSPAANPTPHLGAKGHLWALIPARELGCGAATSGPAGRISSLGGGPPKAAGPCGYTSWADLNPSLARSSIRFPL